MKNAVLFLLVYFCFFRLTQTHPHKHHDKKKVSKDPDLKDYEKKGRKLKLSKKGSKSKNDKHWEVIQDNITEHYPEHMKEKMKKHELKQSERDQFENEYGLYKSRAETKVIDLTLIINQANDLMELNGGDMMNPLAVNNLENSDHQKPKKSRKSKKAKKNNHSYNYKRDAVRDRLFLWSSRVIPYLIHKDLTHSIQLIQDSMTSIEAETCLKFVPRTTQKDYILFVKKNGCYSFIGRQFSGEQEISLGTGCLYFGIIIHEIMHALGFYHEQSRPDRDNYVEIFWENILPEQSYNFQKVKHESADLLNSPYDLQSIMHYGKYTFAVDSKKPTIQNIVSPQSDLGQRNYLSPIDIYQINSLYDCKNNVEGWSSWSNFGPCNAECEKYRERFCMKEKYKTCKNPVSTEYNYWGTDRETIKCTHEECNAKIDGHWNKWMEWGRCSSTCDEGKEIRTRECTDPLPKNGGADCVGEKTQSKSCKIKSCTAGPHDCTFDMDIDPLCGWEVTSAYKWLKQSGGTMSSSTGPTGDHTSGTGHFLFIETSSPAKTGDQASLESKTVSPGEHCLEFAYNMYGASTGDLQVLINDSSTSEVARPFLKVGNQLKDWHEAVVDVHCEKECKIIFVATRGSSFQGDIAIDDLVVRDGTCEQEEEPENIDPISRVGCYNSYGYVDSKRVFPELLNLRGSIVWDYPNDSFRNITMMCAVTAKDKGYEYFGIEFWGECWMGPRHLINYSRDGDSTNCWPPVDEDMGPYLIGAESAVMVYRWNDATGLLR